MTGELLVRATIERFHDAVNRRDAAAVAALFTDDGVWEVAPPFERRFEGREAIERGIAASIGATVILVQTSGPIVVDVRGASASARTSLVEFARFVEGASGGSMHVAGAYHDELTRSEDGQWRFRRRRFVASYYDDLPVPGVVVPSP